MAVLKYLNPETGEWATVAGGGSGGGGGGISIATCPEAPTGTRFWIDTDDDDEGSDAEDTKALIDELLATLDTMLNAKAPAYTYGTDDLTAGTSPLETGKLYFVYE